MSDPNAPTARVVSRRPFLLGAAAAFASESLVGALMLNFGGEPPPASFAGLLGSTLARASILGLALGYIGRAPVRAWSANRFIVLALIGSCVGRVAMLARSAVEG